MTSTIRSRENNNEIYNQREEGFPCGSVVKNPPAKGICRRLGFDSPGWEDPLEEVMPTHSSILARTIPWTEEPGRLQSMGSQSQTQLRILSMHTHNQREELPRSAAYSRNSSW